MYATIIRTKRSDQGTEGILIYKDFSCFSLELPWRGNERNVSCIPADEYDVTIRYSPRFGRVYWILKVEGRTYILIHSGNTIDNTYGCILVGKKRGYLNGKRAVLLSRKALREFMNKLNEENFKLHIIEAF